jgi:hypothetical protein
MYFRDIETNPVKLAQHIDVQKARAAKRLADAADKKRKRKSVR